MKHFTFFILLTFLCTVVAAQKEFHVFPENHNKTPGTKAGDGSLHNPWDLQTALSQKSDIVNGGDTVWLHGGTYNGKFVSNLKSTIANKYVTVASIPQEWAVLNGNVPSTNNAGLTVAGPNVIYKNFEVTWLDLFSRATSDKNFVRGDGISHNSGINCKFINLDIHDNPGLGFGSWKRTGGTTIENCFIYNNGYMSKNNKGRGEGMYVQNSSDEQRIIKDNIIFNNYYKGIEVWSANKRSNEEYVKNITLQGNIIFNSGYPSGHRKDNLIVATDDRNGINIAKNINIIDNIFYHNTNVLKNEIRGAASSLTLGFYPAAPVENIKVHNNVIIGRNNSLRIFYAKSLSFKNNTTYCGYVHFNKQVLEHINTKSWDFSGNNYFSKNRTPFRISKHKDYTFNDWNKAFKLDLNSKSANLKDFNLKNVLDVSKNEHKANSFRVVLFNKIGNDVEVDFSKYNANIGASYTIYDIENKKVVLKSGKLNDEHKVVFPMNTLAFKKPLHNIKAQKTPSNFGVYIIDFEENAPEKRKGFFARLFDRLF